MKTAALMLVAFAFLTGCADDTDRTFEPVAVVVVEPNDVKVCECMTTNVQLGTVVCHDQFCDPCRDSCDPPTEGQWDWTCNSIDSEFGQFENRWLCEYPNG